MSRDGGSWRWKALALVLGGVWVLTLVFWLVTGGEPEGERGRSDADMVMTAGPGGGAPDAAPPPRRRLPDPPAFGWEPFGDDWEGLLELPALPGPLDEDVREMRRQMREEMRRMRRDFRQRMRDRGFPRRPWPARPGPGVAPSPPGPPVAEAPEGPEAPVELSAGVEVVRLELPDAVVLIVRGAGLVEGSLSVRIEGGRVVVSGESRAADGVVGRFSRSFPLDGEVAAERVDVKQVDGGYRVVLPR